MFWLVSLRKGMEKDLRENAGLTGVLILFLVRLPGWLEKP